MNKFVLAAVAVTLSAGAAFAENPNVGTPDNLYTNESTPVVVQGIDYTTTASISASSHSDGSANGFGDHLPSSF